MAGRRRGFETVGDMVRSLGLVLAAVAVILLITLRPRGEGIRTVDYRSTLAQARVGAPYALVEPAGLGDRWRPTSVYFDPPARSGMPGVTTWHVGFVTPDGTYAAFEQTNGSATDMLKTVLDAPQQEAPPPVAPPAGGWQRWTDAASERRALVRTDGKVTCRRRHRVVGKFGLLATALRAMHPWADEQQRGRRRRGGRRATRRRRPPGLPVAPRRPPRPAVGAGTVAGLLLAGRCGARAAVGGAARAAFGPRRPGRHRAGQTVVPRPGRRRRHPARDRQPQRGHSATGRLQRAAVRLLIAAAPVAGPGRLDALGPARLHAARRRARSTCRWPLHSRAYAGGRTGTPSVVSAAPGRRVERAQPDATSVPAHLVGLVGAGSAAAASSRARAPSSQRWQISASASPRSQSASDSSSVVPPASSRRTTSTSSSRACS